MKVTNNLGLPVAFVKAVSREQHNADGCYSATTLLKGVQEIILTKRNWQGLSVDASESVWQVFGSAVHSILEKQNTSEIKEARYSVNVSKSVVTGQVDCYEPETKTLFDYKTASVWKVQLKDFEDWKKQGLIYAWLMKKNGVKVEKCKFIALLKDHSKSKARFDSNYPQSPTFIYEFDVTSNDLDEIEKFIFDKISLLERFENCPSNELPLCSDSERWADGEKWAVMKKGRKSAVRVFDTESDAKAMLSNMDNLHYIEHRPPIARKCADYCLVCDFCNQYQKEKKRLENEN